ncbi:hypothetical protein JIP62_10580 [Brevundimonas vitis]|uniref:DNA transposition protein n=1 Tax=Brevundimonas vitisensis TaxID=2800818 RepID=A0ABX7BLP6_9CAUL|nr:hypothetical protein [Brevundimonas vitisensis]QQQ17778.1 hypothetical protein JIP62_10580 [Brevundimonas vitisensis]
MGKRDRIDPRQMALSFDAPARVTPTEGLLAGLDTYVAGLVSAIVREDSRSQAEVAAAMSAVLGETVSKDMLYAYAAPSKDGHNISAARFLALVVATKRSDALDALVTRIGCRVLEGEEYVLAQLGHVQAEMRRLKALERDLTTRARPLDGRAA